MQELTNLIRVSKYAGARFDITQAGGGNSSAKIDENKMLIKASGVSLSEMTKESGFTTVNYIEIAKILDSSDWHDENKQSRDKKVAESVLAATITKEKRASIEVFLHALMHKYTLHTHPIAVSAIAITKNWREVFQNIFPNSLCIEYKSPGIELSLELKNELDRYIKIHAQKPKIIFLQNHGLIVSSDDFDEIETLNEQVLIACERYLGIDFSSYKIASKISLLFEYDNIAYHSQDEILNKALKENRKLFEMYPCVPDSFVFFGKKPLFLKSLDKSFLDEYVTENFDTPKVIIFEDRLFFIAQNIKKAKEIEDVFKAHILSIRHANGELNHLTQDEMSYLGNWEAEKFRQKI